MSELIEEGVSYSHVHVIVDGVTGSHSFTSVAITRSLNKLGSTFSVQFPNRWVNTQRDLPLIAGRRVRVILKERNVMIDGFIDKISTDVDESKHVITISGRDKTGDLVDCSPNTFEEFTDLTLGEIAERVCAPFQIPVFDIAKDTMRFPVAKFRPGETVFSFLNRISKQRGLLLNSVPAAGGGLAIVKVGQVTYQNERLDYSNILACSMSADVSKVFSDYTVISQTNSVTNIDGDEGEIEQETNVIASVKDASARREIRRGVFVERPKTLVAEKQSNSEQAKSRAQWEHVKSLGESIKINIVVNGWLTRDKDIWRENRKIRVVYPFAGLDGIYLITSCSYVYGADESIKTTLTLTHKDAYTPRPSLSADVQNNLKFNLSREEWVKWADANNIDENVIFQENKGDIPTNDGGIARTE